MLRSTCPGAQSRRSLCFSSLRSRQRAMRIAFCPYFDRHWVLSNLGKWIGAQWKSMIIFLPLPCLKTVLLCSHPWLVSALRFLLLNVTGFLFLLDSISWSIFNNSKALFPISTCPFMDPGYPLLNKFLGEVFTSVSFSKQFTFIYWEWHQQLIEDTLIKFKCSFVYKTCIETSLVFLKSP